MNTLNVRHCPPNLTAFANTDAGRRDAYIAANWFKSLVCRLRGTPDENAEQIAASAGFDVRATMTEGSGSGGGYTVPSPLEKAFIEYRQSVGVLRKLADVRDEFRHAGRAEVADRPDRSLSGRGRRDYGER